MTAVILHMSNYRKPVRIPTKLREKPKAVPPLVERRSLYFVAAMVVISVLCLR